jgi:hypothetical protein
MCGCFKKGSVRRRQAERKEKIRSVKKLYITNLWCRYSNTKERIRSMTKRTKTEKPKTGMARLMELAATKKPLVIVSVVLSALAAVASFIPPWPFTLSFGRF